VVLAEFDDLSEDGGLDVGKGDFGDVVILSILCAKRLRLSGEKNCVRNI